VTFGTTFVAVIPKSEACSLIKLKMQRSEHFPFVFVGDIFILKDSQNLSGQTAVSDFE
jgi:hypothetical protein